jgi:FecR-like protein
MQKASRFTGLLLFSACLMGAWSSQALASTAGVFQFVAGDVRVVLAEGSERPAAKGSPISVGDTVTTARASTAQIKMGDGAIIVVQPESKLTVAEFSYAGKEDGTERVQFRLQQGGIRSVTGAIGHTNKGNYMIETPIAHIGVRGTDHESWYFPSSVSADGAPTEAGLYNKVNVGLTYIQTTSGEVVIGPNQVGYAASAFDQPHLLGAMPGFFNRSFEPRSARSGGSQGASVSPVATQGSAGRGSALGVDWGTWHGAVALANGRAANGEVASSALANMAAPAKTAAFPPQVITATYNYVGQGGVVVDGGMPPTIGKVNSLSVGINLTTQTITNYSVNATAGAQTWSGSGNGTFTDFVRPGPGISLTATCSGCTSTAAQGTAGGVFAGESRMVTNFNMATTGTGAQSISGNGLSLAK